MVAGAVAREEQAEWLGSNSQGLRSRMRSVDLTQKGDTAVVMEHRGVLEKANHVDTAGQQLSMRTLRKACENTDARVLTPDESNPSLGTGSRPQSIKSQSDRGAVGAENQQPFSSNGEVPRRVYCNRPIKRQQGPPWPQTNTRIMVSKDRFREALGRQS